MKKIFIAFGLFALIGTCMVGVSATAQRYQQYRNSYNAQRYGAKHRPTSYRLNDRDRVIADNIPNVTTNQRGTVSAPVSSTRDIKRIWRGRRYFRPELYRTYPEDYKQYSAPKVAQEALVPGSSFDFDNVANFASDANGIFRSSTTSLAFRVYEVQDGVCRKENFSRCVNGVMDQYRRGMGVNDRLYLQDYSFRQTMIGDFSYQLTYRETFVGRDGNIYFVMALINPNTGKLVRIEGVALPRHEVSATTYMHKVFESFRFQTGFKNDPYASPIQ
ncbi:MAG TPA: hypothetical protein VIT68_04270 [Candidatus Gracilibacteria bacterium]